MEAGTTSGAFHVSENGSSYWSRAGPRGGDQLYSLEFESLSQPDASAGGVLVNFMQMTKKVPSILIQS